MASKTLSGKAGTTTKSAGPQYAALRADDALTELLRVSALLEALRKQLVQIESSNYRGENPEVAAAEACVECAIAATTRACYLLNPDDEQAAKGVQHA